MIWSATKAASRIGSAPTACKKLAEGTRDWEFPYSPQEINAGYSPAQQFHDLSGRHPAAAVL